MQYKRLWIALGLVMGLSFTVLGVVGYQAMNNAPPIPHQVLTAGGQLILATQSAMGKTSGK